MTIPTAISADTLATWEDRFADWLPTLGPGDAAPDDAHIRRVVANARRLAAAETADLAVVIPAAWLHDCVSVPKNSPDRPRASRLAADAAAAWLAEVGYDLAPIEAIAHAIAAHSFTARIPTETIEARVVQDADRLDALGAIGIARTLMLGGAMGSALYAVEDPFCEVRTPDDSAAAVDHFYTKLLGLAATMQTTAGRTEAHARTAHMHLWLDQLAREIGDR